MKMTNCSLNPTAIHGDEIAYAVLKIFDQLPAKAKPLNRGSGVREWVPLCGIVARGENGITCLALATGMKCLPQAKISQAQGIVLHDWHAEILAIRSLNRFLLEECHALVMSGGSASDFIRLRTVEEMTEGHLQPFALKEGIDLHMYCSEAPCGDASMELTMAAQDDATPWEAPAQPLDSTALPEITPDSTLHGRSYFSALGIVRRKPSRPDAPPTLSKSCSDKLALHQCTSLLSSPATLLISPSSVYLSTLTLPDSQYSATACTRAFSASGRMAVLHNRRWAGGYAFHPFKILPTVVEFTFSRRQVPAAGEKIVPSNIAASWIHSHSDDPPKAEVLIGGILQGRKKFDIKGASRSSRRSLWKRVLEISERKSAPKLHRSVCISTYHGMKESNLLAPRRSVKNEVRKLGLVGWVRNTGGEEFEVDGVVVKM